MVGINPVAIGGTCLGSLWNIFKVKLTLVYEHLLSGHLVFEPIGRPHLLQGKEV